MGGVSGVVWRMGCAAAASVRMDVRVGASASTSRGVPRPNGAAPVHRGRVRCGGGGRGAVAMLHDSNGGGAARPALRLRSGLALALA